jgi:hypothetical protein
LGVQQIQCICDQRLAAEYSTQPHRSTRVTDLHTTAFAGLLSKARKPSGNSSCSSSQAVVCLRA